MKLTWSRYELIKAIKKAMQESAERKFHFLDSREVVKYCTITKFRDILIEELKLPEMKN